MGYFDLPTGEVELLLKKRGRGRFTAEWRGVSFTDRPNREEIAQLVEDWSKNYKVMGVRYNGREIAIPTGYHWEVWVKVDRHEELFGCYATRAEARAVVESRRDANWGKPKEERIPIGRVDFAEG